MSEERHPVLPYLSQFACPRTEVAALGGFYCSERAMWMVETVDGPLPAIECGSASHEMLTKTEVTSESDDDMVLELLTKTAVQAEQDDDYRGIEFAN